MSFPIVKDYLRSPSDRGWVNKAGHPEGGAMDIGWRVNPNNPNQPAYSLSDGVVLHTGFDSQSGNYIIVGGRYNATQDVLWSVQHLSALPTVKTGSEIKMGQQFGNMGNTGNSHGPHFHIRISFVPTGTVKVGDSFAKIIAEMNKTRVNPESYLFRYPGQEVLDMRDKPSAAFPVYGGAPSPAPSPAPAVGKYINIKPQAKYGLYNLGVVPVAKNINNYMQPTAGYSYLILESTKYANVYIINTDSFGKQQIYFDASRATITDKPVYQLKGSGTKPKPPVKPSKVGMTLIVYKQHYKKPKFTAYADQACTKPYAPWTMRKDLKFKVLKDLDPVFLCGPVAGTPMYGVNQVYIKWEPGIAFVK